MYPIAYLNGDYVKIENARLPVTDLAVTRGYGLFDYFRYRDRQAIFLRDHLNRFYTGAREMYLDVPVSKAELTNVVTELINRNGQEAGGIRFVLTGGQAEDGYTPNRPNLFATVSPATSPDPALYKTGCTIYLHPFERQLAHVKTIDYVEGIRVQRTLTAAQADYPLYVDREGYLRESDRSNFMIVRGGTLITPDRDILHGITRHHLLQLAEKLGIPSRCLRVHSDDLLEADEAIICSSTKGPMPITGVARTAPGGITRRRITGGVGPVTTRLMEAWPGYVNVEGHPQHA